MISKTEVIVARLHRHNVASRAAREPSVPQDETSICPCPFAETRHDLHHVGLSLSAEPGRRLPSRQNANLKPFDWEGARHGRRSQLSSVTCCECVSAWCDVGGGDTAA